MHRDARFDAVYGGDVLRVRESFDLLARPGPDIEDDAFTLLQKRRQGRRNVVGTEGAELEPEAGKGVFFERREVGQGEGGIVEEGESEI